MKKRPMPLFSPRHSWLALFLCTLSTAGCSVFEFDEYDGFGDWLVGPPGFSKALSGKDNSEGIHHDRPVIYGPFRLPELILQPAGGIAYPSRTTITNDSLMDALTAGLKAHNEARQTGHGEASYWRVTTIEHGAENSLAFDWYDAGAIEVIPYRVWASEQGVGYKVGMTLLQPLNMTMNLLFDVVRAPVLAAHDVLKVATIPVAAIYYARQGDPTPASRAPTKRAKPVTGSAK